MNKLAEFTNSIIVRCKAYGKAYRNNVMWPIILVERRELLKSYAKELIKIFPEGNVLDVGTGPGHFILELAKLAPKIHCIGVDINQVLLDEAKRNATKLGLEGKAVFVQADAQRLPFEDNTFDIVFSAMSLYQWANPEKGLSEIFRVLQCGSKGHALLGRGFLTSIKIPPLLPSVIMDRFNRKSEQYLRDMCQSAGITQINFKYPSWNLIQLVIEK